jgi:hypothetical protein
MGCGTLIKNKIDLKNFYFIYSQPIVTISTKTLNKTKNFLRVIKFKLLFFIYF